MQYSKKTHRGVIGIESAIVMIAFVIVAAALSFVVLNMGLSTTQQAKTTITTGLGEASSSVMISGDVISATDVSRSELNATAFPIKVVSGGTSVNLNATLAVVRYSNGAVQYDNILAKTCVLTSTTYSSMSAALTAAVTSACITANPVGSPGTAPAATKAVIYWSVQKNTNEVLDPGEHAFLVLVYGTGDRPSTAQLIEAELIPSSGSSLSVSRLIPAIQDKYSTMG